MALGAYVIVPMFGKNKEEKVAAAPAKPAAVTAEAKATKPTVAKKAPAKKPVAKKAPAKKK
jgi:hypothetical protein